jgi:hypothetical protein
MTTAITARTGLMRGRRGNRSILIESTGEDSINILVFAGPVGWTFISLPSLRSFVRTRAVTCPECGSTDLYWEAGMITGQLYHCRDCDYVGAFVVETEPEPGED